MTKAIVASQFEAPQGATVAGLSPSLVDAVSAGADGALLRGLWSLCAFWLERDGGIRGRNRLGATALMHVPAERRQIVAAGCDLHDLLISSPQGREALLGLGQKPLAEKLERERGGGLDD